MSKKIKNQIGITYNNVKATVDDYEITLNIGNIVTWKSCVIPPGVLEVTDQEYPINKYKKLANALIANKFLKPNAKTFRLDKILGLTKDKPKLKKSK